ncbi:amidohydrolase [Marivivens niveibacter]|uniref:Amidohydrolase n=1 Tax=Marivivens niveibacter TaxID=1930667 RepID=A0A251X234_9RHOB|nr:M20 aminoacylase family protein [Marivivens niveibacter]OUD10769.1 amidohydrolase [Marivivens niveibacter]
MPVLNRIADFAADMAEWRQHLHKHPELGFDCHNTAAFVVDRLREFGITDIHTGIATSGVVAIIEGQGDGATIGLRADMDALPIIEDTGVEYESVHHGKMHACGHDGHTAMLLGAAKYLAETRNFAGRVALIFQPAEEAGGGAGVMVKEGVLDRFNISRIFALHTRPGVALGEFYTTPGPIMAAVDAFDIHVKGVGGHVAHHEAARDPIVAACAITTAIQTIVSRSRAAEDDLVVSVSQIHTGSADNIIPDTAYINGTVRTFGRDVQGMVKRRLAEIVAGTAAAYGVEAELDYLDDYPPTINDEAETEFATCVARSIVGDDKVDDKGHKEMGAEDFSFFLENRPGAYLFLGNGDTAQVHHPKFNFDDRSAPYGASYFARLVEMAQPRG